MCLMNVRIYVHVPSNPCECKNEGSKCCFSSQYAKLAISLKVPGGGGKKKKAAAAPQGGSSGAHAAGGEEDDEYEGGLC